MTSSDSFLSQESLERTVGPRRPRIALMGEFSAGKSTLANLMIGADHLPVQVVATRLPPVWISYGNSEPVAVDTNGHVTKCSPETFPEQDIGNVAFIRLQRKERILKQCDIIDMPGIADPNMPAAVWERLLPAADGVVWCSPATQAWRQSEAAVWEKLDARFCENSILLLTRADMLLNERDKAKVLQRVRNDASASFNQTLLISLLQALSALEDDRYWHSSGADDFVHAFLALIARISTGLKGNDVSPKPASRSESEQAFTEETRSNVRVRRPAISRARSGDARIDPDAPESYTPKFS